MKKIWIMLAAGAILLLSTGCEQLAGPQVTAPEKAARPVADPLAGAVGAGTKLRLSTATEGAEIYYTTDGTDPDSTKTKYTEAILINAALALRAVAVKEGIDPSATLEAAYVIDPNTAAAPVPNIAAGAVRPGSVLELATATEGAEIYYTTDGTTPDSLYTEPIPIDRDLTIRAIAVRDDLKPSALLEAAYTVIAAAAKPSASPEPGAAELNSLVSLSTDTEDAAIYYTTDGSAPDSTKTRYTGPISITGDLTIKAIAAKKGLADSETLEAVYIVVAPGTTARPLASPPAGAVLAGTAVSLSTLSPGAEIYYTTDGSAPDRTKTRYTEAILINAALTIKAIAVKEGLADSAALEAAYTILVVQQRAERPAANPAAGNVPAGTPVSLSTLTAGAEIYYTTDGTEPDRTKTRYTGAISINYPLTIKAIAAQEGMTDSAVLTAAYTIAAAEPPDDPEEPPTLTGIAVASLPDINLYALGQPFDPAGLVVRWVYSDGSGEELTAYTIDPVNTTKAGQKIVWVRSGGYSAYFTIYVHTSDVLLQNMTFTAGPSKTVYELGENFSKDGVSVLATYSDGSQKTFGGSVCSYSGYDRTKRGVQEVTLKINGFTHRVETLVKIPASATVSLNTGSNNSGGYILSSDYHHVYIKGMPFDFAKLNLAVKVTANGITIGLKSGVDFGLEDINLSGFNPNGTGRQTLTFDLDDKKGISFWIYVADVAPAVWFDYGYQRTASDPKGEGPGAGKYYARPGETLVLAPVRYLIGYNANNSPGPVSYSWSVSGGSSYTSLPSQSGETCAFTPGATGTYTVTVQVTGRNYVTGQTETKTAATEVVCYTGTVSTGKTFVSPLKNFSNGQFTGGGTGDGWSLGSALGYIVWKVDAQDSYYIKGNAFAGWHEAGVVWVQEDRNNNGAPDEMWYELVGQLEGPSVTRRYAITYMPIGYVNSGYQNVWVDSKGRAGIIKGGFPDVGSWVTFTGTLLTDDGQITGPTTTPGGWGYADSFGNRPDKEGYQWYYFFVSDAIRADGSPANLSAVRFIKVQTGIFKYGDVFGEISTEIYEADGLGQMTDFPLPEDS